MRRASALVILIGLLSAACGTSTTRPGPSGATTARTYPPVPAGGTDCGVVDERSGWPTTTVPGPSTYSCLTDALSSGRPARLVVIRPGSVDSGRTTRDGYPIPAGIPVTYRVLGPHRLQITTDRRDVGGSVTTQDCTGLAPPAPGSPPTPGGCGSG